MNYFKALSTALLILILSSGCAIDQKREIETYRKVLDAGQPRPSGDFHANDPLTLREALVIANTGNETLAISGENYLQSLINKERAFARFLPTIAVVPTFMREEKTAFAAGNSLIEKVYREKTLDMPLEGRMSVSPFADIPALEESASSAKMQRAVLLDSRAVLLLNVAQTYYQVVRSETEIGVLTHSIDVQSRRVSDIRERYRAGVARELDVSQAEARLAETRAAKIWSENDVKNGRAMLALLLGVPAVEGVLTDDFELPSEEWQMDRLLRQAMAHREDLNASHARLEAAVNRLQSAWGEYFPSVSLNLTRYLSRESFPDDSDWVGLLSIRIPIFSAGLAHADVRTAYSQLRQASFFDSLVQKQIVRDLRSAREDLLDTDRRIKEIDVEIAAAKNGLRQSEAAYAAGTATNLETITARDQQLRAELAATSARFERKINYLRLLRATGSLDTTLSASPIAPDEAPIGTTAAPSP